MFLGTISNAILIHLALILGQFSASWRIFWAHLGLLMSILEPFGPLEVFCGTLEGPMEPVCGTWGPEDDFG